MPPATEQPRKSKHDSQAAKNSTEHKMIRFLNMNPQQVQRRHKRVKQREYRKALLQSKPRRPPSKAAATKPTVRKARPCCGLHSQNCECKPPPGMKETHLNALSRRFATTALSSVQDTTDVSTFLTLMAKRCKTLPLRVLLAYAHTHVVFNQDHLLRSFIEQKAFLFKPPWFDWQLLQSIVKKSKQTGQRFRSSNYRSTTLRKIRLPSHIGKARLLRPTECPAYLHWYKLLYPDRSLTTEEKFQVLCTTYLALNQKRNCSIPEALAQTCWVKREKNGKLHVDEDE